MSFNKKLLVNAPVSVSTNFGMTHENHQSAGFYAKWTSAPTPAVAASLVEGDLTFTADSTGTSGNAITVAFVAGGVAGAEVVTVVSNAISVAMADGVSTATQLNAALQASSAAMALIGDTISGTGSNPQAAFAATHLAGGAATVAASLALKLQRSYDGINWKDITSSSFDASATGDHEWGSYTFDMACAYQLVATVTGGSFTSLYCVATQKDQS